MKYPSNNMTFKSIREGGFVYVDKTDLVYSLLYRGYSYFISRPSGFGKTTLISTMECYLEGKKQYFKGLKIMDLEKEWKQKIVIHIDFGGRNYTHSYDLDFTFYEYFNAWESRWGSCPLQHCTLGERFAYILNQVQKETGLRTYILVENYDKPLLDVLGTGLRMEPEKDDTLVEKHNLELLREFYSSFRLDYMHYPNVIITGDIKLWQFKMFRGIFPYANDIACWSKQDPICGITKNELMNVFQEPINELADYMACTSEEVIDELCKHYGGYYFSEGRDENYFREDAVEVLNTSAVINAFRNMYIDDYWSQFKVPDYLKRLLSRSEKDLNELAGKYYEDWQFLVYDIDEDNPLPLLYLNGYLTIKDYNDEDYTYLIDFPNEYAKRAFQALKEEVQKKVGLTF